MVLGFPILILLALLVKISSKSPIFFIQVRVGRHGKPYKIIKFRTMSGTPDKNATHWTKSEEDRITSVGRFMRDYGLDELPQLFNIIKGDMSIVGPRSLLPQQVETFAPRLKKCLTCDRVFFLWRPLRAVEI